MIQKNLDKLENWALDKKMKFTIGEGKALYLENMQNGDNDLGQAVILLRSIMVSETA